MADPSEEKLASRQASERGGFQPPYVLQRAFNERVQELTTLDRLMRNELLVNVEDRLKFALELNNYHRCPVDQLAAHFQSSVTTGLSAAAADAKLHETGRNVIASPKVLPLWVRFILCFFAGFAPLLWFAAGVVFLSWKPFGSGASATYNLCLAVVLLLVIFVAGLFQFHQEVATSRALSGFHTLIPPTCIAIRDGVPSPVAADALVVGDVVVVESGGRVPADMRIIESSRLRVDKSLLTGESEPVSIVASNAPKDVSMLESRNMLFTGCNVTEGQGKGIVVATGADSQLSKIAQASSGSNGGSSARTTLQREIDRFVFIIACFALVTATVVVVWWAAVLNRKHKGFMNTSALIANAISVLVAYIPEGLPLALAMGLAIIASRLCRDYKVLLKRLGTVETLGSMSLLASDKTGTLTQNLMTVVQMITLDLAFNARSNDATVPPGVQDGGIVGDGSLAAPQLDATMRIAALCNQSQIETVAAADARSRAATGDAVDLEAVAAPIENGNGDSAAVTTYRIVGSNGVDKALLQWACAAGRGKALRLEYKVEALVPFSSATKTAFVVVRRGEEPAVLLAKGAPEFVVAACESVLESGGTASPLTPDLAQDFAAEVEHAANQGQRVVGLAQLELPLDRYPIGYKFEAGEGGVNNFPTTGLQLVTCVAVSDPPRPGVAGAVEELRAAGIKIAMVTGDAPSTALSIARLTGVVSAPAPIPIDTLDAFLKPEAAPATSRERISRMFRSSGRSQRQPSGRTKHFSAVLVVGPELETLAADGWNYIFEHDELVFARTTPEQKLQIVKESQGRGHRVGVTGDGVNDGPALRRADVGVAMFSGADSAKDAAAVVLLNNDFAAIVHAVQEGRLIFSNLRKVIAYQISAGCWAELIPVLATFFVGMPQPLSTLCMILISCLTDVFAGVALMNERAEKAIMREPPRDVKKARLVDFRLVSYAYFFYANLVTIGCFLSYFVYMYNRGPTGVVPDPIPADNGDLTASDFPAGYTPSQLIFAWNWGLADGPLGDDAVDAANTGSSVYFLAIVIGQMGHLLSIRRSTPYFAPEFEAATAAGLAGWRKFNTVVKSSLPPLRVPLAWLGSTIVALILTEIPAIQNVAGTGSVPARNWGISFAWSALCFLIAEARKWIIYKRPNSCVGRTAW